MSPAKRKQKSGGFSTIINEKVVAALEERYKKEQAKKARHEKPPLLRRIMGTIALGVWMLFMVAEFFHWVEHVETLGHDLTKWSPLFIGILLLAPDAFDRLMGFLARMKGIKFSLPPKEDEPSE
jgi:hypothetical protein